MKHINLSVDETTWEKAETFASAHKTSVTDLLLTYLDQVVSTPVDKREARARLVGLSNEAKGEVGTRDWKRDDLYGR